MYAPPHVNSQFDVELEVYAYFLYRRRQWALVQFETFCQCIRNEKAPAVARSHLYETVRLSDCQTLSDTARHCQTMTDTVRQCQTDRLRDFEADRHFQTRPDLARHCQTQSDTVRQCQKISDNVRLSD